MREKMRMYNSFMNMAPSANDHEAWMSHLRGLISFTESATRTALTRDMPAERSQRLMERIQRLSRTESEKALRVLEEMPAQAKEEMKPRCTMGCAHCCYQWVRASVPEVLAVVQFVRENFTDQQRAALLETTKEYEVEFRAQDQSKMFALRCPLLVNDLCSVYEARPLICRGTASLDAEACRMGKEDPNSGVQVPFVGPLFHIAGALRQGLASGTVKAGYRNGEVVFGLALRIALEDPQAGEKFFAGEDVFALAAPPDAEPFRLQ